ncbi:MAG TPA: 4-(cytidine 5'-diphospho)-2-C-methyl-D-erythritol kinase, partial [Dongiaceae bacterium]|nr:4-(cytidine 5'-diphospho)-2-C-methyl-D-erythritol kinase [Dongiaceae bacterium]
HIREIARAKINLTLTVLRRRPDGYHDIESLVTFADIGDLVTLVSRPDRRLATSGPFAVDIEGENLLSKALMLLRETDPDLQLGAVELEKNLPVAAGLGGGSADAAALLRAVRQANPERAGAIPWHELAARLGADVPVCLAGKPALMRGIGDRIAPLGVAPGAAPLAAVLVNPRLALATAQVFQARAVRAASPRPPAAGAFANREVLIAHMRAVGNDLEAQAVALLPVIADLEAALAAQPGCLLAAMSGSGPTCFGIFDTEASADRAAAALRRAQPLWWVVQTRLDSPV